MVTEGGCYSRDDCSFSSAAIDGMLIPRPHSLVGRAIS